MTCLHCLRDVPRSNFRHRGLCQLCYGKPAVRCQFPAANTYHDGVGMTGHGHGTPTTALPGTEEKVAVLAARAEAGLLLWHPQDRRRAIK